MTVFSIYKQRHLIREITLMPYATIKTPRQLAALRRLALSSQGLLQSTPFGKGVQGTRQAISHIGYVQVDTISVVERAHHHVLHSRVPGFKPEMTNQLLVQGDVFEYWAHAAAFLPIENYRFSLPYKQAIKGGQTHWYRNPDKKLMRRLLERVRSDGPLRARDLESSGKKASGWWDWKPAKKALEQLYMQGDLMVCDRQNFQKTYDLTERVLPTGVNTTAPTVAEFAEHLLDLNLCSHGLVSLRSVTYLRRNPPLRNAVKALAEQRLAAGELEQVFLPNGEQYVFKTGALDARMPRVNNRLRILSPFDNSVIQRERLRALFDFDYQIECYVPEPKRKYGYFCLPLLYRDQFIGRMDCKAHRKTGELEIKAIYLEPHDFDDEAVISALAKAVSEFSVFQQCHTLTVKKVYPKHLTAPVRLALCTA